MDSFDRSSTYELSNNMIFDSLASHIFGSFSGSKNVNSEESVITAAVTSSPATPPVLSVASESNFLQKIAETFVSLASYLAGSSKQIISKSQSNHIIITTTAASTTTTTTTTSTTETPSAALDAISRMDLLRNHIIIDSSSFESPNDLRKQLEYDKFMNEVWIGVVLTLIIISMVFCFCSCFLYHQFKQWKRSYHQTVAQSHSQDIESMKLNPDIDDPVPEYTLVSGLPSYEAALELLRKAPASCLMVYPSLCSLTATHEKEETEMSQSTEVTNNTAAAAAAATVPLMTQPSPTPEESKLSEKISTQSTIPSYEEATSSSTRKTKTELEKSYKENNETSVRNGEDAILLKS